MKTHIFTLAAHTRLAVATIIALQSLGLSSCASISAGTSRDADAVALAALSQPAFQRAARVVPDPVLRQVDVIPPAGRTIFYFTDTAATLEIDVDVPTPNAPAEQWRVRSTSFSKLVGFQAPALNMTALHVGSASVIRALTSHWSGCTPTSVILFGKGDDLEWTGFCKLPDGRLASGTTDNRTGEFHPSPAPPAYPPPTAMPK